MQIGHACHDRIVWISDHGALLRIGTDMSAIFREGFTVPWHVCVLNVRRYPSFITGAVREECIPGSTKQSAVIGSYHFYSKPLGTSKGTDMAKTHCGVS